MPRVRPGTRARVVVSHAGADAPARARARGLHAPADAHGTSLRLPRRQTAACTHPVPHPPRAPPQRCPRRAPRVARRARPPPRASSRPTRPSLQPPPPRAATCGRAYGARRARATRDSPPLQPHPPSVPPPCPLTHPHCALPARAPKAARRARRQNELTLQSSHKCKIIWYSFYPNSTQTLVPYEFAGAPLHGDFCRPHLTRARRSGNAGPRGDGRDARGRGGAGVARGCLAEGGEWDGPGARAGSGAVGPGRADALTGRARARTRWLAGAPARPALGGAYGWLAAAGGSELGERRVMPGRASRFPWLEVSFTSLVGWGTAGGRQLSRSPGRAEAARGRALRPGGEGRGDATARAGAGASAAGARRRRAARETVSRWQGRSARARARAQELSRDGDAAPRGAVGVAARRRDAHGPGLAQAGGPRCPRLRGRAGLLVLACHC